MRPACIHGLVDHCARCPITDERDDNEPPPWQAWPGAMPAPERHSPTWGRCPACAELVEPGKRCQTVGCAESNDASFQQQGESDGHQ